MRDSQKWREYWTYTQREVNMKQARRGGKKIRRMKMGYQGPGGKIDRTGDGTGQGEYRSIYGGHQDTRTKCKPRRTDRTYTG